MLKVEDFEYFEGNVIQWNKVFGNPLVIHDNWSGGKVVNGSLIPTYKNLALEEAKEIIEGVSEGNRELILDGIADSLFTVGFWCNLNGYFFANDDIKPLLKDIWTTREYINSLQYPFTHYAKELIKDIEKDDALMAQENLINVVVLAQEYYDILGAYNRVLESNYSKAADKETVDTEYECAKIEEQGRYTDLFTEESEGYIIFRAKKDLKEGKEFPKGKIVKPSTFKDVDDLGGLKEFCL